jgi:hypothetical protein
MITAIATPRLVDEPKLSDVWRAGVLTAIIDGAFSSVLSVAFYGSTVTRLFQSVASTLLGPRAFERGLASAAIGVLMHVGVAFAWSFVFFLLVSASSRVRAWRRMPFGAIRIAAFYGPGVWLVMSLLVIPLLTGRPPTVTVRWWIQLIGHFPFVGLPIVGSIGRRRG